MSRRRLRLGRRSLGLMVVVLVAYGLFHSPLRILVDRAFTGECEFFCRIPRPDDPIARVASSLWLIVLAVAAASITAVRAVPGRLERTVAWGLLSYGLIAIPAALVGFLGDRLGVPLLRPPLGPLLASLAAAAVLVWHWRQGWRPTTPSLSVAITVRPTVALLLVLVLVSQVLSIGMAMAHPPTGSDSLGYHGPLAVLLWREGSLESFLGAFANTPALSHPGGAELWQGLLLIIGGDPLALAGQLPFAWLAAGGIALFARRVGLPGGLAYVGGLLFLLAPMVLEQSGAIRNDVIGAAMVITTFALLAGPRDRHLPVRIVLACLGIGLLAVTKLALLPAVAVGVLAIVVLLVREWRSGRDMRPLLGAVAVGIVIIGLAVAPWWLRNIARVGNPLFPADLPFLGGGIPWNSPDELTFVPDRLLWPFYPIVEPFGEASGFGGAFAVGIIPALAGAAYLGRRRPLVLIAALAVATFIPWWFLDRREPRFLLGLAGLCFALIPFALAAFGRRWRMPALALLSVAVLGTSAVWMATAMSIAAGRPSDREDFYEEQWGTGPVAMNLPEDAGILVDDLCSPGFVERLYPFFGAGHGRPVGRLACSTTDTAQVERILARRGLAYVYLVGTTDDVEARAAMLYPENRFELVDRSTDEARRGALGERRLFRWLGGT